jgi:hypothetical protein
MEREQAWAPLPVGFEVPEKGCLSVRIREYIKIHRVVKTGDPKRLHGSHEVINEVCHPLPRVLPKRLVRVLRQSPGFKAIAVTLNDPNVAFHQPRPRPILRHHLGRISPKEPLDGLNVHDVRKADQHNITPRIEQWFDESKALSHKPIGLLGVSFLVPTLGPLQIPLTSLVQYPRRGRKLEVQQESSGA